jgi:hypothetical protein
MLILVSCGMPHLPRSVTLYWTGIMASPVPSVRALASWEGTYTQGLVSRGCIVCLCVCVGGRRGGGERAMAGQTPCACGQTRLCASCTVHAHACALRAAAAEHARMQRHTPVHAQQGLITSYAADLQGGVSVPFQKQP